MKNMKNPIVSPKSLSTPQNPEPGYSGIYPGEDGRWYVINSNGEVATILDNKNNISLGEHGVDAKYITGQTGDFTDAINLPALNSVYIHSKEETLQDVLNTMQSTMLKRQKVDVLPTENIDTQTIYMVPAAKESTNNIHDEYMRLDDQWEHIGSTAVDLTDYAKKDEVVDLTSNQEIGGNKKFLDNVSFVDLNVDNVEASGGMFDGTDYLTFKEEGKSLKEILDEKIVPLNALDGNILTDGFYSATGNFTASTGTIGTDKIPCKANQTIYFTGTALTSTNIALPCFTFYDIDGNYISYINEALIIPAGETGTVSFVVPDNENIAFFSTYASGKTTLSRLTISYESEYGNQKFAGLMPSSALFFDEKIKQKDVEGLNDIAEQVDFLTENSNISTFEYSLTGFENLDLSEVGGVNPKSGADYTYANAVRSEYMPTDDIVSVTVSAKAVKGYMSVIACYDANYNFLKDVSVNADSSEHSSGSIYVVEGTVNITDDIKYIRISHLSTSANATDTITLVKTRGFVEDYTAIKEELQTNVSGIKDDINPWKGKSWYAFGTSITDTDYPNTENDGKPTGMFAKYLVELSGLVLIDCGRAGGTIATSDSETYPAKGAIYTKITETDFSNADLITLEGFINDFAMCIPIGEITDTTTDTLCGAMYLAIKHLLENSNATIVLITDSVGKTHTFQNGVTQDYSTRKVNALGLHQVDYTNAMIKMAQYMGVHCIDAGSKSQINEFHPEYIVDQCHHTELGGKQFAYTIWEELKNIHCNNDVVVE